MVHGQLEGQLMVADDLITTQVMAMQDRKWSF